MLSIAGLAGGAHDGATAGHAAGGAGIAEDGAEHAADEGPAHGAFGGVTAGADLVGDGAAVAEVLLVLGFVHVLFVDDDAVGGGAGGQQ